MERHYIWEPISFDPNWNNVNTKRFDNIVPSWERKRKEFSENPVEYEKFLVQLKRKQAIDTGVIERMYDLREGITETFIKEGFVESYLQHGDTDIEPNLLMGYLRDNFDAIDFVFDFVNSNRQLSAGFIKSLHSLITKHQEKTEAKDQFGNLGYVTLRKGEYKIAPNNPQRIGVMYEYCPPEQVSSEMDNLIAIVNNGLSTAHIVVRAAFIHHAFVQIHPFQDGNGRIARLLASLVFIKGGLFPLALDRKEKSIYIDALEAADQHDYQPLIDVFMNNQIKSMEKALNWKTIEPEQGYSSIVEAFEKKIDAYKTTAIERRNEAIMQNMLVFFNSTLTVVEQYKNDLSSRMPDKIDIRISSDKPNGDKGYFFSKQIIDYANKHNYFLNTSFPKAWIKVDLLLKEIKQYNLIFSIHHYGYDNNTFALGSFISYEVDSAAVKNEKVRKGAKKNFIDIASELPPLTVSSERHIDAMLDQVKEYVEQCFVIMLAYMSNEL